MKQYVIVILDRGFIYVGLLDSGTGNVNTLSNAKNIRRWGTTKGLGELVLNGPTKNTILDDCGTIIIPEKSIVSIHPTNPYLWK